MTRAKRERKRRQAEDLAIRQTVARGITQGRRAEGEHQVAEARALIGAIEAEVASVP